jgi:hypothetical protein
MMIDYNKWREGAPYDLAALAGITTEERELLTGEICQRSSLDWRDVEALRALATPTGFLFPQPATPASWCRPPQQKSARLSEPRMRPN